ncbi:hypothetical protein LCGC14_1084470 [marine sediment metagenome]|uniref:Uncharacterized protein n=1 Tax=marine sediment metagenome TaxID=412755 RepID=A0A0F9MED3_9ZZZZ
MLKIMRPNLILVTIESVSDMNEIRRSFMGDIKGSPNLLMEIKKIIINNLDDIGSEDDIVVPVHFSIIKKPVSIHIEGIDKPRTSRKGVGAMILYEYLGSSDDLKLVMDIISSQIEEKVRNPPSDRNWMTKVTNYEIILGKNYKDIKE